MFHVWLRRGVRTITQHCHCMLVGPMGGRVLALTVGSVTALAPRCTLLVAVTFLPLYTYARLVPLVSGFHEGGEAVDVLQVGVG